MQYLSKLKEEIRNKKNIFDVNKAFNEIQLLINSFL
jgi:hypothetical protein